MAMIDTPAPQPVKTFTVCESYEVRRLGRHFRAEARMAQCDYLTVPLDLVSVIAPANDGSSDTIAVPLLGRSLLGHIITSGKNDDLATVTAQVEEEGDDVLTLSGPLTAAELAGPLFFVERMVGVGSIAYTPAPSGRSWRIILDASSPQALQELMTMLGTIGVQYGMALAAILETGTTQQQMLAAVQALAAQGVQVDALYAQQAEGLEAKRRAGQLAFAGVMGSTP